MCVFCCWGDLLWLFSTRFLVIDLLWFFPYIRSFTFCLHFFASLFEFYEKNYYYLFACLGRWKMDFLLYNFVAERKPVVDTLDDLSLPSLSSIAVEFGMVKEIASTERKRALFYCVCGPVQFGLLPLNVCEVVEIFNYNISIFFPTIEQQKETNHKL